MANNLKLTNLAVNTMVDALTALLPGGFIDIYDGSQPSTADTAITSQVKLARLTLGSPAFGAAVAGVATANAITSDSSADASGLATWFRLWKSDGTTKVFDGSVGISGSDLNIGSTSIVAGALVSATSFTITHPKS